MFKVPYGQDPYSVIGEYIRNHITVIEDIIAVIEIDGSVTNTLFMVDMDKDGYFIWNTDWYEGEKDVVLIDFFPVSEATKSIAEPERKRGKWIHGREIARQYLSNELVNIEYENYHCSECGYTVENIRWNVDGELIDRYCSVCGVEMEGEQDV